MSEATASTEAQKWPWGNQVADITSKSDWTPDNIRVENISRFFIQNHSTILCLKEEVVGL